MNKMNETNGVNGSQIKTKLLRVYVEKGEHGSGVYDYEKPNFLVSYKANNDEQGIVVREPVMVVNTNTDFRYYGQTPIVFIPVENIQDIETLKLAQAMKLALDDKNKVYYERHFKTAIKTALNGQNIRMKKLTFVGEYARLMLYRPDKDFCTYTHLMFRKANGEVK